MPPSFPTRRSSDRELVEEGTGEEGSFVLVLAVARRRPVRQRRLASLRPVHPAPVLRLLVAALPQPGEPGGVVLRQLHRTREARQHLLIGGQALIVRRGGDRRSVV